MQGAGAAIELIHVAQQEFFRFDNNENEVAKASHERCFSILQYLIT